MQYLCAGGLVLWVVCLFIGLALVRADLRDIAERGDE